MNAATIAEKILKTLKQTGVLAEPVNEKELLNSIQRILLPHDLPSPESSDPGSFQETVQLTDTLVRRVFDEAPIGVALVAPDYRFIRVNDQLCRIVGRTAEELLSLKFSDITHPDDLDEDVAQAEQVLSGAIDQYSMDKRYLRKDGSPIWIHLSVRFIRDAEGNPLYFLSMMEDISRQKRMQEDLVASEQRLRSLMESMNEGVMRVDNDDRILFVNDRTCIMFGYSRQELIGKIGNSLLIDEADRGELQEHNKRRMHGIAERYYMRYRKKNGDVIWCEISGTPIYGRDGIVNGSLGVITDITERRKAEEQIRNSLKEKDMLLKEIHHRVRNNLAVISSMLGLQTGFIKDAKMASLISDARNRVLSIATIHERLYRSQNLSEIDFADYVRSFAGELLRAYNAVSIRLEVDMANVKLGVDTAIPLGLIVNELVSNCLKHAFPGRETGTVIIRLHPVPGRPGLVLSVKDDGVGFPPGLGIKQTESLGLQLVNLLARQLGGSVEMQTGGGTEFRILVSTPL